MATTSAHADSQTLSTTQSSTWRMSICSGQLFPPFLYRILFAGQPSSNRRYRPFESPERKGESASATTSSCNSAVHEVDRNLDMALHGPFERSDHREVVHWGRRSTNNNARYKQPLRLRSRHLGILTRILHRALYDRDFERASRAWGMLLRTEQHGMSFDLRAGERWGIGAELKLQCDSNSCISSIQQLETIKKYFSRLILQFPYHRHLPKMTSSLQIYPVYYSTCIHRMNESLQAAGHDLSKLRPTRSAVPDQHRTREPHTCGDQRVEDVCRLVLKQGIILSKELNNIVLSPPYSDNTCMRHLNSMLALWLADLSGSMSGPNRISHS